MLLTIFTPVYNRAYCLHKLYKSLCHQSCTDFEWIIVDDGKRIRDASIYTSKKYRSSFYS